MSIIESIDTLVKRDSKPYMKVPEMEITSSLYVFVQIPYVCALRNFGNH